MGHLGVIAMGGSALLHAALIVVVAGGHGRAPGAGRATDAELSIADVELAAPAEDVAEASPQPGGGGGQAVPTHTHPYPVPFDHDSHPHDPNLVHLPGLTAPDAHAVEEENPYANVASSAPSSAEPLHFHIASVGGAAGVSAGASEGGGSGAGGGNGVDPAVVYPAARVSTPARALATVLPAYPPAARAADIEGTVLLEIVVDTSGSVAEARVARAAGHGFDDAALVAIRRFRFSPATLRGQAVRVRMLWPVEFALQ